MNECFLKYKDIYKGRTALLMGTGITLRNIINKELNPEYIKIGVNSFVYNSYIGLDYFFAGDPNGDKGYNKNRDIYNNYEVNEQKFYRNPFENICGFDEDNNGTNYNISGKNLFVDDISKGMGVHTSIIFEALQFIVYTGVSRIYLIGISKPNRSTEKWLSQLNPDYTPDAKSHVECWNRAKEWLDIEVIDIDSDLIKGVFKEGGVELLVK